MKNSVIQFRCTEMYKKGFEEEAKNLGLNVSQFIRFCEICRVNLENSNPELYNVLVEMLKYNDV